MTTCCDPSGYRRMFDTRTARRNADAYRRKGLESTARALVDELRRRGVAGATVLEVGGGVGGVQLELLAAGAVRAVNVELSPDYEAAAAELAAERGATSSIERRVGDFVELGPSFDQADVVVLHRVVCCYRYLEALLAPAARLARRTLAITYPRASLLIRAGLRVGNAWFWLTRCPFRVFVHSPAEIQRLASDNGLRPAFRTRGLVWETVIFARA